MNLLTKKYSVPNLEVIKESITFDSTLKQTEIMEKQLITIEDFKIGRFYYGLEAEVYYYDNGESETDDYPACSELEVHSVEVGDIWAHDTKTDAHYEVTNEDERRLVIDSIDWGFELEKSL